MAAPELPDNSDLYDLGRFLAPQRDTYADALAEIRSRRKHTHWMWFVFPQIQSLGSPDDCSQEPPPRTVLSDRPAAIVTWPRRLPPRRCGHHACMPRSARCS